MSGTRYTIFVATTVDGFIADEEGGIGFLDGLDPSSMGAAEFMRGVDLMIQGGTTYEQVLGFGEWPYGTTPNVVLTRRALPVKEGAVVRFHAGPPEELLQDLKTFGGHVWVVGGGRTVTALLNAGMRPALEIALIPRMLGRGIPLFQGHDWGGALRLVNCRSFANGCVILRYEPNGT